MDPLTITRSTRLAAAPTAVWEAMATGEGLAGWLGAGPSPGDDRSAGPNAAPEGDRTTLEPGTAAVVTDSDGSVRRLVVTEVERERRLGFTWWDDDRPADASTVVIEVEPAPDGPGARVTVTESLHAGPNVTASVGGSGARASAIGQAGAEAAQRWDARLVHLLGSVGATALVAVGA